MSDPIDLHALADGELDQQQAAAVRVLLLSDAAARAEYDSILNLKDFMRHAPSQKHSDECWRACVKRLNEIDKAKKVEFVVGRYAWALCGVLFVAILGSKYAVRNVMGDSARTADLGRMFPFGGSKTPAPSAESRQYVADMLREARQAIDPLRLHVVSATKSRMGDIPVICLGLRDGGGPLALYVIESTVNFEDTAGIPTDPGISTGVIPSNVPSGHVNCLVWDNSRGQTIVLAGDRSTSDLEGVIGEGHLR